jgi:hypothetical protein
LWSSERIAMQGFAFRYFPPMNTAAVALNDDETVRRVRSRLVAWSGMI